MFSMRREFDRFIGAEGMEWVDPYPGIGGREFDFGVVHAAVKFSKWVSRGGLRVLSYPTVTKAYKAYFDCESLGIEYKFCPECGHYHLNEVLYFSSGKCPFLLEEIAAAIEYGSLTRCDNCGKYHKTMNNCAKS